MAEEFDGSEMDEAFVEIDAEEINEWLPNEEKESDVSLTDVLDMERRDSELGDDENAFESTSDVEQDPKQRKRMNELKAKGYGAVSVYRDAVEMDNDFSELEDSIDALIELVMNFGDPESLDELIALFSEIDPDIAESPLGMIEEFLAEFVELDILNIHPGSLAETPEQLTIELQQQLLQALSLNMPGTKSSLKRIF